jgi:hypothetical protein
LENDYVLGTNKYPAMLAEALLASVDGVFGATSVQGNHEKVEEVPVSGNRRGKS